MYSTAAHFTASRQGLTALDDSIKIPRPDFAWPTNRFDPCGAGMP
jgi:hypothetical protein